MLGWSGAAGTVGVNELFCIETQERDTLTFDIAAVVCGQQGMRLCTWGQWYTACTQATTLGLLNMTGEWEWTNSAANATVGTATGVVLGVSSGSATITATHDGIEGSVTVTVGTGSGVTFSGTGPAFFRTARIRS